MEMKKDQSTACKSDSASPFPLAPAPRQIGLVLLRDLEASLRAGRKALLALDLPGIEQETREQAELARQLAKIVTGDGLAAPPKSGLGTSRGIAEADSNSEFNCELGKEIERSRQAVLQSLRLHSALLARARGKLRMIANLQAGVGANYGPPPFRCAPQLLQSKSGVGI